MLTAALLKVLVIGGNGFLGQYIVGQLLEAGHEVHIFCRSQPKALHYFNLQGEKITIPEQKVHWFSGDILDLHTLLEATKGINAVFHVASKEGITNDFKAYTTTNIVGTENVIAACQQNKVSYLIYTSTASVVYNHKDLQGVDEHQPYGKSMPAYPATKAIAEQKIFEANGDHLQTITIRPHLIWGNGDTSLLPRLIEKASQRQLRQIGQGKNLVDCTHVIDAAWAHLLALKALLEQKHLSRRIFFIGSKSPVNLWAWISSWTQSLQLAPPRKSLPCSFLKPIILFYDKLYPLFSSKEPPLNSFLYDAFSKHHYFDHTAAQQELGYYPRVSLSQGMEWYCREFFERKQKINQTE